MTTSSLSKPPASHSAGYARPLALLTLVALIAQLLVSGPSQVIDPFVKHDDYPALLLMPELYYWKTLAEGRWINYLWLLRWAESPAWLNNLAYQLGWCLFAAATALHALGQRKLFYSAFLATLIVLGPQATVISGWFNTHFPGILIIAAYAVLTLFLRPKWGLILLIPFVPLSLMSYSTFPLLLLGVYLARHDTTKGIWNLVITIVFFTACFASGLLLINTINFLAHGSFDIEMATWRQTTPASDLAGLLLNLVKAEVFLSRSLLFHGFGVPLVSALNVGAFVAASLIMFRFRPMEAAYILAGLLVGYGLLVVYILTEGTVVAFRATVFSWMLLAIMIVRAAYQCIEVSPLLASSGRIAVMFLTLTTALLSWTEYDSYKDWQRSTLSISEQIPESVDTIFVYGPFLGLKGGIESGVQEWLGLELRLKQLTGAEIVDCNSENVRCVDYPADFDPKPVYSHTKLQVQGNRAFLGLPEVDLAP